MANKKPWCAEGACRPAVPMHTKGCPRRAEYEREKARAEALEVMREALNVPAEVLDMPAGLSHFSQRGPEDLTQAELDDLHAAVERGVPVLVPVDSCRSADGYHVPGCPSASAKRIRAEAAAPAKPGFWKRVLHRG